MRRIATPSGRRREEGGNQVVVLDDLGEVGAFGIAIEVRRAR
jgi:hypothetical protein